MAATCIHGFAPGTCLICQTLDGAATSTRDKKSRTTTQAAPIKRGDRKDRAPATVEATGPRVLPSSVDRSRFPASVWIVGGIVGLIVAAAAVWTLLHAVFAVLHIVELVAAAMFAGYIGWIAGVHHGRSEARHEARRGNDRAR